MASCQDITSANTVDICTCWYPCSVLQQVDLQCISKLCSAPEYAQHHVGMLQKEITPIQKAECGACRKLCVLHTSLPEMHHLTGARQAYTITLH